MESVKRGVFAALLLASGQALGQACPEITVTITPYGFEAYTASAGTSVVVRPSNRAAIESCAQAFVPGGATVSATSATLTMSGSAAALAVATVSGAYIPTATRAAITGLGGGTISIGPSASQLTVDIMGPPQAVTIDAGAVSLDASCQGASCYLTALGVDDGYIVARGGSAFATATFSGTGYHSIRAEQYAQISATGPSVTAYVQGYRGPYENGISGMIDGPDANCQAENSARCYVNGDRATVSAGQPGYVEIVAGTGGFATAYNGGTLSIAGGNRATVGADGVGSIGSGAAAFISSGNGDVFLSGGATGTLEGGATIFSAPGATVTAAPDTTFTSIGTRDDYVLLAARSVVMGSMARRRVAPPAPTSRCGLFSTECPNLRGEFRCVDIKTDILNCGGCALDGTGIDCTTLDGQGELACIDGRCAVIH